MPSTWSHRAVRSRSPTSRWTALVTAIVDNQMPNGEVVRLDGALRMAPR